MLCKHADQTELVVSALRGGPGEIIRRNLFGAAELPGFLRLAAILEVAPGCGIGRHAHTGETEFFYVLEGELSGLEDGHAITLAPGDVTLTGGGQEHCLENRGTRTAKVLALIVNV